jgi:gas vesicle protein
MKDELRGMNRTIMTEQEFQRDSNNPGYFVAGTILGSLLGGLVGAGVMLLLAPQSGEKTRKQLWRKGRDLRLHTVDTIEDGADAVRTKSHEVKNVLHNQAETLQQHADDFVDQQKERWSPVVEAGVTAVNHS